MKLFHPHFGAAIFVGVLVGVLSFALVPLVPVWTREQVEPIEKPSPTPVPTTPTPAPGPSPEPPQTPPVDPTPEPTALPSPPAPPRRRFPPPMPACAASNPESLYEEAFTALESGNLARTEALFEDLAVCRGEYALAIGSMYDPTLQLSGNLIEHDPRKALHFYTYAAVLGKRVEVLERLEDLSEAVGSRSDLRRDISSLEEELSHPQR